MLAFGPFDSTVRSPIPPPAPNGGWYTGQSCAGKPWCTVATVPDANVLNRVTLPSAGPPPGATQQPPTYPRSTNNYLDTTGMCSMYGIYAPLIHSSSQRTVMR